MEKKEKKEKKEKNILKKDKIIGGGIIFTALSKKNNSLYFLLGRENKYCINGSGKYCDFGGGNDGENIIENVSREASEETIGFFGNKHDIKKMFDKYGYYFIDNINNNKTYRIYFLPIDYDDNVNYYFNNNQKILQEYLPKHILKTSKIFEKDKIEWFSIQDLKNRKNELRKFFKYSALKIIQKEKEIKHFIYSSNKTLNKTSNKTLNKTLKLKKKYNKTLKKL